MGWDRGDVLPKLRMEGGLGQPLGVMPGGPLNTAVSTWSTEYGPLHVSSPNHDLVLSPVVLSGTSQEHARDHDNIKQ